MIIIRPIEYADAPALDHTEYGSMSAEDKGFSVATGAVSQDNVASHALHRKLGFETDGVYTNKQGKQITLYIKAL